MYKYIIQNELSVPITTPSQTILQMINHMKYRLMVDLALNMPKDVPVQVVLRENYVEDKVLKLLLVNLKFEISSPVLLPKLEDL